MRPQQELNSFLLLRANGWSLAKISKELNVSKSTLWEWDQKNQNEVYLLKHLQLEKLQEKYVPTYEEELSKLRGYLDRLETALESQDFSKMGPEYLLQMALNLRARLGKMREQVPLRTIPFNQPLDPLPFTGCVSRQDAQSFGKELMSGESEDKVGRGIPAEPSTVAASRESAADHSANNTQRGTDPEQSTTPTSEPSPIRVDPSSSVVDSANPNRTFPDENTPRRKNRPLYHNDFRHRDPEPRPVLHSQDHNGKANGNGHVNSNGHLNDTGHQNGNGHHLSEDRRHQ